MIVGIAGGSCSGKTTIARQLAKHLPARLISLDDYFLNPATFPTIYEYPDYDRMETLAWPEIMQDIGRLAAIGHVVAEGFLLLAHAGVRARLDIAFFIEADETAMTSRRLLRDPDTPAIYIERVVAARYRELVRPTKRFADHIIPATQSPGDAARHIETIIREQCRLP